jgi:hypothetical protein
MSVKMSPRAAQVTTVRYVCANCWEPLVWDYNDDGSATVTCETEGCPCSGFISKRTIEHIEAEARNERLKAEFNLRKHLDWIPYEKQSNEQILSDLGF